MDVLGSILFGVCSLCCSDWVNSIDLSWSQIILLFGKVPDSILCHPHSITVPIQWVFISVIVFFQFYNSFLVPFITSISLLRFLILSFVSRDFVTDCWSIFTTAALKSLSDDSTIWFIWCWCQFIIFFCSSCDFHGSWNDRRFFFFLLHPRHFVCYARRL